MFLLMHTHRQTYVNRRIYAQTCTHKHTQTHPHTHKFRCSVKFPDNDLNLNIPVIISLYVTYFWVTTKVLQKKDSQK